MRLVFLLLLLANLALFVASRLAAQAGGVGGGGSGHEPGRLAMQVNPERIHALTDQDIRTLRDKSKDVPSGADAGDRKGDAASGEPGAAGGNGSNVGRNVGSDSPAGTPGARTETSSGAATDPTSAVGGTTVISAAKVTGQANDCLSWGDFTAEPARRVRERLARLKLGDTLSEQATEVPGLYTVATVPVPDRSAVEARADRLRKNSIGDLVVVSENSPPRYSIALGSFLDQDLAVRRLAEVNRRGVADARIEPPTPLPAVRFLIRGTTEATLREISGLQKEFPRQKQQSCGL